jgi:DNA repair protein RecO (recombination protein O)
MPEPVPVEVATPAFVLHARPYGESDRIVTFLTEKCGKLTGIAKGARNSRRRFGGTLEPFVHVRVVYQQRPSTDLAFLLRCELIEALRVFSRDLDRYAAGTYLLELTDRMVLGREPGGEVYRLIRDALRLLDRGAPIEPLLCAFELHLLAASGYAPALDHCRGCGTTTSETDAVFLALARGELVCRRCVRPRESVRPVAAAAAAALAKLAGGPLAAAGDGPAPAVLAQAQAVAEHLVSTVVAGPLRSRAFLKQTRVDSPGALR